MFSSQEEARRAGQQRLYDTARVCMWDRLGYSNHKHRTEAALGAKPYMFEAEQDDYEEAERMLNKMNSLDCCQPTITNWIHPHSLYPIPVVKEETRTDMYNKASATIAVTAVKDDSLDYILRRLKEIYADKQEAIRATFNYYGFKPESIKQAKQWLKDGFYRIDAPEYIDEESLDYCSWKEFFEWGDKPVDLKAYETAESKLKAAIQVARDVVQVKTDEDVRLKALQDFEAFVVA
jgi:hypothetical protein